MQSTCKTIEVVASTRITAAPILISKLSLLVKIGNICKNDVIPFLSVLVKRITVLFELTIHGLRCHWVVKDTGSSCEPHFSFVMLNYFRTNQYEEP